MDNHGICFTFGMLFGAVFAGILTYAVLTSHYESGIIDRGYGLYCPKDGEFAFKGECDDPGVRFNEDFKG